MWTCWLKGTSVCLEVGQTLTVCVCVSVWWGRGPTWECGGRHKHTAAQVAALAVCSRVCVGAGNYSWGGCSKTTTTFHLGLIRKAAGSESEQCVAHTLLWLHTVDYGLLDWDKAAAPRRKNSAKGTDTN